MTKILEDFVQKNEVVKRINKLKTEDMVKKRFEAEKALTSSSLIVHEIHNLNNIKIINHILRTRQ